MKKYMYVCQNRSRMLTATLFFFMYIYPDLCFEYTHICMYMFIQYTIISYVRMKNREIHLPILFLQYTKYTHIVLTNCKTSVIIV